jgi:hypothetical protein
VNKRSAAGEERLSQGVLPSSLVPWEIYIIQSHTAMHYFIAIWIRVKIILIYLSFLLCSLGWIF